MSDQDRNDPHFCPPTPNGDLRTITSWLDALAPSHDDRYWVSLGGDECGPRLPRIRPSSTHAPTAGSLGDDAILVTFADDLGDQPGRIAGVVLAAWIDVRLADERPELVHRRLRLPEDALEVTNHARGLYRSVSVERYVKSGDRFVYELGAWPCAGLHAARDKKLPPKWQWWKDTDVQKSLRDWWFATRDDAESDLRARRWQLEYAERTIAERTRGSA